MKGISRNAAYLCIILTVLLIIGPVAGCKEDPHQAEREALQAKINTLNGELASAQQAISDQQSTLEGLRQRLSAENAGLNEYNARVQSYMLQHKMAVAAIVAGVAGSVPWLKNNGQYSENAKDLGLGMAVIAAIWALEHMDEVSEVLGVLNESDAHVKTLQAEISRTSSAIEQQQASLQQLQSRAAELSQQTDTLHAELARL